MITHSNPLNPLSGTLPEATRLPAAAPSGGFLQDFVENLIGWSVMFVSAYGVWMVTP
jgi:hypothetical protein